MLGSKPSGVRALNRRGPSSGSSVARFDLLGAVPIEL